MSSPEISLNGLTDTRDAPRVRISQCPPRGPSPSHRLGWAVPPGLAGRGVGEGGPSLVPLIRGWITVKIQVTFLAVLQADVQGSDGVWRQQRGGVWPALGYSSTDSGDSTSHSRWNHSSGSPGEHKPVHFMHLEAVLAQHRLGHKINPQEGSLVPERIL